MLYPRMDLLCINFLRCISAFVSILAWTYLGPSKQLSFCERIGKARRPLVIHGESVVITSAYPVHIQ